LATPHAEFDLTPRVRRVPSDAIVRADRTGSGLPDVGSAVFPFKIGAEISLGITIAPPGSDSLEIGPNADVPPLASVSDDGSRARGRPSDCEPWRNIIQSKCNQGLSAQRIYQDLTSEHSFGGSYYTVRRFVRRFEPVQELPFRRLECEPGDEVQVDFGTGAPVITPDGKRHRTHVFRIVLSHSRKAYREAVYR
jgi:hypothetical protein